MQNCAIPIGNQLLGRLARLYPDVGTRCLKRAQALLGRYGVGVNLKELASRWSEKDVILITYGDMIQSPSEKPLVTLHRFLNDRLKHAINTVHILPFFPYSSDDGFSVIDYRKVDPTLGSWEDIRNIGTNFHLMFDLVLNHVSKRSTWFRDYLDGIAPARHFFIEVDPKTDLSAVVRPRAKPLLSQAKTRNGVRHVWTTFSEDQIDLNFANPDVLFEFLDILFFYLSQGVRIIRLDAIAYLWKRIGTKCIHLEETHEVVKIFRDILEIAAPEALLLTETNVPQEENITYFGNRDEAHIVYQFSLPPLLLHALHQGQTTALTKWAMAQSEPPEGCTFLNFTASHDGIGVRPLEGIIPKAEIDALANAVKERGGHVSTKRNSDGTESPYELNISYFDALADPTEKHEDMDVERFLCSQTVPLALKGIPALYFHSLIGTRNDHDGVKRTGHPRTINRKRWDASVLTAQLADKATTHAQVFREYVRRLRIRARHKAFHPKATQRILDLGPALFAVERSTLDGSETVTAISNFTANPIKVSLSETATALSNVEAWKDLLNSKQYHNASRAIQMAPYQTRWLVASKP